MRPLENSLAIWKKSQKDKKDSAAAKKKASGDKSKESEDNSEETDTKTTEDKPADDESEECKNDEDKENKWEWDYLDNEWMPQTRLIIHTRIYQMHLIWMYWDDMDTMIYDKKS